MTKPPEKKTFLFKDGYERTSSWVREKLKNEKPGWRAQLRMAPDPRPGHVDYKLKEKSCRKAGVLILLYPHQGKMCLLLTRRTDRVFHHRAQISFPGGSQERGESLQETALREACEELGIDSVEFDIFGQLTPLYIPPSGYCIYPTVAGLAERPDFTPHPVEVAEIIEVPLECFFLDKTVKRETWTLRGLPVGVPFFYFRRHKIWGATAMVLAEFLALLKD